MGQAVEDSSMLNRALKSLCCSYGWSFGVFWCYNLRNSMLLTLEDAYYEDQMGVMIDQMLLQVHLLGEGIIGQTAFTRKHQWISFSSIMGHDMYQDGSHLHGQFSCGIKTIVAVPVESWGVLQFGSINKIVESLEFLDRAKRLICQVLSDNTLLSFKSETSNPCRLIASATAPGNSPFTPGLPVISENHLSGHSLDPKIQGPRFDQLISSKIIPSSINNFTTKTPCMSTWSTECSTPTSVERQHPSEASHQNASSVFSVRPDVGISNVCNSGKLIGNGNFNPYICETDGGLLDDLASVYTSHQNPRFDESLTIISKPSVFDNILQWLNSSPSDEQTEAMGVASISDSLDGGDISNDNRLKPEVSSVPRSISTAVNFDEKEKILNVHGDETDLIQSLGLDFGSSLATKCWEDIITPVVSFRPSINMGIADCLPVLDASFAAVPRKGLFSELGIEQLLDNFTCGAHSVTKSNPNDQISTAKKRRIEAYDENCNQFHLGNIPCANGLKNLNHTVSISDKLASHGTPKEAFPKSRVCSWIDDNYSINAVSSIVTSETKKHEDHKKGTKKRTRPGESTRPRPKDRQLIQDRLKELKEIIPNSGKLSIDGLLDQTIKHMLFLQSVKKYADRLKHEEDEPKLIGQENGVVLRDNFVSNGGGSGGATWAFEVGAQTLVCPIIVEDINPPGQMLIEMLCEEGGFFLEIADIIRGYSLTILNGVMEVRESKLWARFTVEANESITRMDIFLSLVNLLQQTGSSGKNMANNQSSTVIGGRKKVENDPSSVIDGSKALFNNFQQPLESLPVGLADAQR